MTRYINLAEFVWLAEQVTGLDASVITNASRIDLADSALHAPAAGFGDDDFYPDPYDKAAVLACRLAWNHPLPDGNKRAAWACLVLFIDLNDGHWDPDPPNLDEAETAMLRSRYALPLAWAAHELAVNAATLRQSQPRPTAVLRACSCRCPSPELRRAGVDARVAHWRAVGATAGENLAAQAVRQVVCEVLRVRGDGPLWPQHEVWTDRLAPIGTWIARIAVPGG